MRVAIVGSRAYQPLELMERVLDHLMRKYDSLTIVSGGEPTGVDALAASMARNRGLDVTEHLPKRRVREEFFARNTLIANDCDMLIALYADGPLSPGTTDTVMKASGRVPVWTHHEGEWVHN